MPEPVGVAPNSSMPRPERDVVHGIDGDFTFGGEGPDFDEMGALFGFGPAFEFGTPFGSAAVEFFGADEGEGAGFFGLGGFGFHGGGLVEVHFFGAEIADEGARVADSDLDVGFEFDACAGECGFAFLEDTTHGLEWASDGFAEAGNGGVENEAISLGWQAS